MLLTDTIPADPRPMKPATSAALSAKHSIRFAWAGGGMGYIWFRAMTPDGTGEVQYISDQMFGFSHDFYKRGIAPDVWEREIVAMRNVLIWHHPPHRTAQITIDILRAFNAWRQAEHTALIDRLKADPFRYGDVEPDDPLLAPPPIVRGGNWNIETNRFDIIEAELS